MRMTKELVRLIDSIDKHTKALEGLTYVMREANDKSAAESIEAALEGLTDEPTVIGKGSDWAKDIELRAAEMGLTKPEPEATEGPQGGRGSGRVICSQAGSCGNGDNCNEGVPHVWDSQVCTCCACKWASGPLADCVPWVAVSEGDNAE